MPFRIDHGFMEGRMVFLFEFNRVQDPSKAEKQSLSGPCAAPLQACTIDLLDGRNVLQDFRNGIQAIAEARAYKCHPTEYPVTRIEGGNEYAMEVETMATVIWHGNEADQDLCYGQGVNLLRVSEQEFEAHIAMMRARGDIDRIRLNYRLMTDMFAPIQNEQQVSIADERKSGGSRIDQIRSNPAEYLARQRDAIRAPQPLHGSSRRLPTLTEAEMRAMIETCKSKHELPDNEGQGQEGKSMESEPDDDMDVDADVGGLVPDVSEHDDSISPNEIPSPDKKHSKGTPTERPDDVKIDDSEAGRHLLQSSEPEKFSANDFHRWLQQQRTYVGTEELEQLDGVKLDEEMITLPLPSSSEEVGPSADEVPHEGTRKEDKGKLPERVDGNSSRGLFDQH